MYYFCGTWCICLWLPWFRTQWENNFWLDLDFLSVAKAAMQCSAYFTALLYMEVWRCVLDRNRTMSDTEVIVEAEDALSGQSSCETGQTSSLEDPDVQNLLLEVYSRIGEPDSMYGACAAHSVNEATRVRMYEHEGEWQKSLSEWGLSYDIQYACMDIILHVLSWTCCCLQHVAGLVHHSVVYSLLW